MTYALRIGASTIEQFSTYNDLLAEVSRLGLAGYEIDLIAAAEEAA